MAGERDSTEPLDCKDVGVATLNLPAQPPRPEPDPRQVRDQPGRSPQRHRHRPDRGGSSIDVDFETEAVMNAEDVAERSSALRLLNVS